MSHHRHEQSRQFHSWLSKLRRSRSKPGTLGSNLQFVGTGHRFEFCASKENFIFSFKKFEFVCRSWDLTCKTSEKTQMCTCERSWVNRPYTDNDVRGVAKAEPEQKPVPHQCCCHNVYIFLTHEKKKFLFARWMKRMQSIWSYLVDCVCCRNINLPSGWNGRPRGPSFQSSLMKDCLKIFIWALYPVD